MPKRILTWWCCLCLSLGIGCRPGVSPQEAATIGALETCQTILLMLDSEEAARLATIDVPTPSELQAARLRVARLRAVRDLLVTIRDSRDLEQASAQVALVARLLRLAVDEIEQSHPLPEAVHAALRTLEAFTPTGGPEP